MLQPGRRKAGRGRRRAAVGGALRSEARSVASSASIRRPAARMLIGQPLLEAPRGRVGIRSAIRAEA